MAEKKISELAADTVIDGSELLPTAQGGLTKSVSVQQIADFTVDQIPGGSSEVVEAFTEVLTFDAPQKFSSTTQTAAINFTLAGAGNVPRSFYEVEIFPDGVNPIAIDEDDFHVSGAIDSGQVVNILFYYPSIGTIKPSAKVSVMPTYGTLAAFSSFTATMADQSSIDLAWGAIPFASQYTVYFKKTADPTFAIHGATVSLAYALDGLDAATSYDAYVVATRSGMTSSQSATEVESTDVASTLTYPQTVTADSPVYYNRMQDAGTTQTPVIGAANMTLAGGAVPQQSGAYGASLAVQFDGVDDNAVVTLPITTETELALELFFYQDQSPVPSDDGTLFALGAAWSTTPGGIGASNSYSTASRFQIDYVGSNGTYSKSIPKITTVGWHHLVVIFEQGVGMKTAILNGVVQTITTHVIPGGTDTANFETDLYLMSAGTIGAYNESGKIQDLAAWVTPIPANPAFQLHYTNRNN